MTESKGENGVAGYRYVVADAINELLAVVERRIATFRETRELKEFNLIWMKRAHVIFSPTTPAVLQRIQNLKKRPAEQQIAVLAQITFTIRKTWKEVRDGKHDEKVANIAADLEAMAMSHNKAISLTGNEHFQRDVTGRSTPPDKRIKNAITRTIVVGDRKKIDDATAAVIGRVKDVLDVRPAQPAAPYAMPPEFVGDAVVNPYMPDETPFKAVVGPISTFPLTSYMIPIKKPLSKKVFIVHGHDEALLQEMARFLEKLQLEAVILREQADEGKTIIEKIEAHTEVGYAVVLYTADDLGHSKMESSTGGKLKSRARQNVVLEHGYLMAKLGRNNVTHINKGVEELPGDINGMVYTPGDGSWKGKLIKELSKAGYDFKGVDVATLF